MQSNKTSIYETSLPIFHAKQGSEEKKEIPETLLFQEVSLPYIPSLIDFRDLKNNKLYSEEEIKCIKEMKDIKENERTKKYFLQENGLPTAQWDVILRHDDLYAIYKGKDAGHIGKGSYGFAKLAQHLGTGDFFAYKIVAYDERDYKNDHFQHEIDALTAANQLVFSQLRRNNKHKLQYEMLIKLAPGTNVFKLLWGPASVTGARIFTPYISIHFCILAAESLQKLHQANIIHGDLALKNCIYHPSLDNMQYIDLGRTVVLAPKENEKDFPHLAYPEDNRTYYMAPESANGNASRKVDIFGLGIMFADLLKIGSPSEDNSDFYIKDDKVIKLLDTRIKIPSIDLEFKKMIQRMLEFIPSNRPSLEEVITFLYAIQKKYILTGNAVIRTAYIDLHFYCNKTNRDWTPIHLALIKCNEIILVDTNNVYSSRYLEIHRDLEKNYGSIIHHKIIQSKTDNVEMAIRQHIKKRVYALPCSYESLVLNKANIGGKRIFPLETVPPAQSGEVTRIHTSSPSPP